MQDVALRWVLTVVSLAIVALMLWLAAFQARFLLHVGTEHPIALLMPAGLLIFNLGVAWFFARGTWRIWVK